MPNKNVTVSVRLDQDDARFLQRLDIGDADTLSEKLRAIIHQAREHDAGKHDYVSSLKMIDTLLDPVRTQILDQERREGRHSELISRTYEWLPDMMAFVLASLEQEAHGGEPIGLKDLEDGVAERVFRLIHACLRLGLEEPNPCYSEDVIGARLTPTLKLAKLLEGATHNGK